MSPKFESSALSSCGAISRNVYPLSLTTSSVMSSSLSRLTMLKSCIGGTYPSAVCTVLLSMNVQVESGYSSSVNVFCTPSFSRMNVVSNCGPCSPSGISIPSRMFAPIW